MLSRVAANRIIFSSSYLMLAITFWRLAERYANLYDFGDLGVYKINNINDRKFIGTVYDHLDMRIVKRLASSHFNKDIELNDDEKKDLKKVYNMSNEKIDVRNLNIISFLENQYSDSLSLVSFENSNGDKCYIKFYERFESKFANFDKGIKFANLGLCCGFLSGAVYNAAKNVNSKSNVAVVAIGGIVAGCLYVCQASIFRRHFSKRLEHAPEHQVEII